MDANFIKNVASQSLAYADRIVSDLLPAGKIKGCEYVCGSLGGGPGDSCSVNLNTGKWADFATGDKGGDLVSLYAKTKGVNNLKAAQELAAQFGISKISRTSQAQQSVQMESSAIKPPTDVKIPTFIDKDMGEATHKWAYKDENGELLFYVCRYTDSSGKKQLKPFTYNSEGKWQRKGWPAPRPLYGLELLKNYSRVLLVEGEKAADAARAFASKHYAVMTWPNGAQAVDKTDWSTVYGKEILIWPDHDAEGKKAAAKISGLLLQHCPVVKVIDTSTEVLPDGWDAADSGFDWPQFLSWAKPKIKIIQGLSEQKPEVVPQVTNSGPAITNNILVTSEDAAQELTTKMSPNESKNIKRCGLQTSKMGLPTENLLNVSKILTHDFSGKFWFDEFYRSFYTSINGQPEPLRDKHILDTQALIQAIYGMRKVSKSMVTDAITSVSYSDKRNAAKEYFMSLKWDGIERMSDFFANACGADDNNLNQAICRYFFSSIMARVLGPELDPLYGNKVDSMIVLEGHQGLAKGMFLKTLIGKMWHFEISTGVKDKDFFQNMRGKIIGEVAELASFEGENLDTIKRVISCQTDRLRVSYGKESEDFDRTCILVGTTNKDEYLTDDTGNRRFLPIKINKIDLDLVIRDREQILAEAVEYYKNNIKDWWSMPKIDLAEIHSTRMVKNEWQDEIELYLTGKSEVKIADIWVHGLKQELAKLNRASRNVVAQALKNLKWEYATVWNSEKHRSEKIWKTSAVGSFSPTPQPRQIINFADHLR